MVPQPDTLVLHHLLRRSLEYYAAGRFCAMNQLHGVGPNLLHHAVEFALKAALATRHSLKELGSQYGHDLVKLWAAVITANPNLKTPQRHQTIVELHKFEALRYPDNPIVQGATVTIAFKTGENPLITGSKPPSSAHATDLIFKTSMSFGLRCSLVLPLIRQLSFSFCPKPLAQLSRPRIDIQSILSSDPRIILFHRWRRLTSARS